MATLTNHKFGSAGTIVDVWTDPGDLPNSAVTEAYNMYADGTVLRTRPGINGLLTTPMANPIYGPFPYVAANGSEYIVFCSGPASSSTGAKIYQVASTGGTATEILDETNGGISFNINAEDFSCCLGGQYLYMCWGASIYRTSLDTSFISSAAGSATTIKTTLDVPNGSVLLLTAVGIGGTLPVGTMATVSSVAGPSAGVYTLTVPTMAAADVAGDVWCYPTATASSIAALNPPVTAPTASLSNIALDSLASASGWSGDTIASTWSYTDLSIESTCVYITSAAQPFDSKMIYQPGGNKLVISSGTGFTTGSYEILYVTETGVAIVNGAIGTAGSTGGHGSISGFTAWTDIVIQNPNKFITSALRPFQLIDETETLTVTSNSGGWSSGSYTISSVFPTGVAQLATSPGTAGSTAGVGSIAQALVAQNLLPYGQTDLNNNEASGYLAGIPIGTSWTVNYCQIIAAGGTGGPPASYANIGGTGATAGWLQPANGSGFVSTATTNVMAVPLLASPNAYRNVNQFYMIYDWYQPDSTSNAGVTATLTACSDTAGQVPIGYATDTFTPNYADQGSGTYPTHDHVFTFPGLASQIQSVVLTFTGVRTSTNPSGGLFGVFLAGIQLAAIASGTEGASTYGDSVAAQSPGILIAHGEPTPAFYGAVGGSRVTKDYGSGSLQDWAASPVITFNLAQAPGNSLTPLQLVADGLSMSLVLRQNGSNTEYGAPLTVSTDGTYMSVDLSAYVPLSVYGSFEYLAIEFDTNVVSGQSTAGLFIITSITQAGNLPISTGSVQFSPITYYVEELNNFGDSTYSDPLESSFGPVSNVVQPTPVYAVGEIVIPAQVNATSTAFAVFRGGGTFDDGLSRLVATVPIGSDYTAPFNYSDLSIESGNTSQVTSSIRPFVSGDVGKTLYQLAGTGFNVGGLTILSVTTGVATLSGPAGVASSTLGVAILGGDPLLRDLQNPFVTWDHTTRTLTDNTPDSFLNLALTMQFGRDLPPSGVTSLAFHQNRLWAASGQTISGSWDTTADAQNGVYFTNVDLSTDPYEIVKGVTFTVGYGDNDSITALLSTQSSLLVLKGRSAAVIDGSNPTNFQCSSYLQDAGLGCVAHRAAVVAGHSAKAMFLGPDNVYVFNGDETIPIGTPMQPQLHPEGFDGTATISASLFAKSAMMYWNQRLFIFAPASGASENSICYVFDFRPSSPGGPALGWTTWGLSMTSGRSLTGSNSGYGAFMGGYDGQLYTFAAGGDKTTPSASATGVPFTVVSRGMGEEQQTYSPTGETGMNFIEPNECSRLYVMGKVQSSTALTFFCYSDDNSTVQFSQNYTVTKRFVRRQRVRGVVGEQIFVGVSGSVTQQATIRMLGCEVEKRKVPT